MLTIEQTGNVSLSPEAAGSIPTGRPATFDEIGSACGFLCSDAPSYMTGQGMVVNGGLNPACDSRYLPCNAAKAAATILCSSLSAGN